MWIYQPRDHAYSSIAAIYLPTIERSTLCFGHRDYPLCVCHINNDCLWGLHTLWLPLIIVRFKVLLTTSNYPKQSEDMNPPKFCIGDYNITIWFLIYLRCKLIKSIVCHMLWILTSEEFDEFALDGIIIPHGQWKIALALSHWLRLEIQEPSLGVVCYTS